MQKLLLFDLDGTLTDSAIGITNSIQHALTDLGYPTYSREFLNQFVGPPLLEAFPEALHTNEEETLALIERFSVYFDAGGKFDNKVYEGIPELLTALKSAGYRMEIASSKPEHFVGQILEHFDLMQYMDAYNGAAADESLVEKPDIIRMSLQNNGFADHLEDVLMIGDRKYDVYGAKECGIPCVGVLWGYGGREELEAAGANDIVETIDELKNMLI